MDENIHVAARVPVWVSDELKKIAEDEGLKTSDIIRDALKGYVEAIRSHRCPECDTLNEPDAAFCKKCGRGLTVTDQDNLDRLLEQITADPEKVKELLKQLVK